ICLRRQQEQVLLPVARIVGEPTVKESVNRFPSAGSASGIKGLPVGPTEPLYENTKWSGIVPCQPGFSCSLICSFAASGWGFSNRGRSQNTSELKACSP